MATVLPTWKLELIEKKKRREEEEKKRAEQEYARSTAIPEWKRSLIHRRKVSSEGGPQKKDLSPVNSFAAQTTRKTFPNLRNDGNSFADQCGSQHRSKRDGTSQEADEIGRIKGGGTSRINGLDSGQAKDLKDDHVHNCSNLVEDSGTGTDDDSTSDSHSVAYEHVRRPSVVKLMFENATAPKFDGKMASSSLKHVSPTNSFRESKFASPGNSDTSVRPVSTQPTVEQSRSPKALGLKPEHRQAMNSTADAHHESVGGFREADCIGSSPQPSDIGVNGEQINSNPASVKSLRNIFGGARERGKTSSVESLPKAAASKDMRPPSPRKRWSSDVASIYMLASQSTEDLSLHQHPPLHQRGRSVSLSDIREEQLEEHFKHKQNVASGLEKRLNMLIRQVSLSEGEMEVQDNLSQSSDENSLPNSPETFPEETEILLLSEESKSNKYSFAEQSVFGNAVLNVKLDEKSESMENKAVVSKNDNEQPVPRPSGGSVHKLSALFGASIWNGAKKAKEKPDSKTRHVIHSIAEEKKQSTKEINGEAKVVPKEPLEDWPSISIPWLKKQTESEILKSKIQSETSVPSESAAPIKGTLHTAGHPGPYQAIPKNHLFDHKYRDTLERNKPRDVTKAVPTIAGGDVNNDSDTHMVHSSLPNENRSNRDALTEETTAVPVSAIDMPELEEDDVSISIIDVPYSGVNVSIIDYPQVPNGQVTDGTDTPSDSSYLMSDELSDNSSDEEMEGSYTVTSLDEMYSDEDEDEVPVSCIDDLPDQPVPTIVVVFETAPENVKSCIRPKNWKKKGNIFFREHVVIHDYPSEDCLAAAYDDMDGQGKTIQTYKPASLTDIEEKIHQLRQQITPQDKPAQYSIGANNVDAVHGKPEITYADDGQAFTDSSDSAGALLF